jgi:hypothetical protein
MADHVQSPRHVGQIVFGVGQNECGISPIGPRCRFLGGRKIRGNVGRVDGGLATGETYETLSLSSLARRLP